MTSKVNSPQIITCNSPDEASRRVAMLIADVIGARSPTVLGLATGGTPVAAYHELVRMHREEGLDFSDVTSFNLDEYIGLAPSHPQSFRYFMQAHLFDQVNILPSRTFVPDGLAADVEAHARRYEASIRAAGGIDLQLLGIGSNGHIAFNEPGSPADSRTRVVQLSEATISANARFFGSSDDVPKRAITMGIGTILEAQRIVLMATGNAKAQAIQRAVAGPVDEAIPASLLRSHADVTYVLDAAAAAELAVS